MPLEHGEKVLNAMEDIKIAMLQRTFSAEQRESTLASPWSARGYTVQNGGLSMKRTIRS